MANPNIGNIWFMKYGNFLSIHKNGIHVVLNGYYFAFFKGMNSGKWSFSYGSNIWRKSDTEIPPEIGNYV